MISQKTFSSKEIFQTKNTISKIDEVLIKLKKIPTSKSLH